MQMTQAPGLVIENTSIDSASLGRSVAIDFYLPSNVPDPATLNLLLINDGQNMEEMGLQQMLSDGFTAGTLAPVLCVAIHCGSERKMEYGVAGCPDYLGRGAAADKYTQFILNELLPFVHTRYQIIEFSSKGFAGFSLGGLSALGMAWNNAPLFDVVAVFSGSLWWRSIDQDDPAYRDDQHRIMHQAIRAGEYQQQLRFFFQSGNMDETHDRNNNGIIDSIDDTLDLIAELKAKGYDTQKDIHYLEMADGRHDIPTWAKAFPIFLKWAWGRELPDDGLSG